jgi:hypothetical protein
MKLFSLTFCMLILIQFTSGFLCSFCPDGGLREKFHYVYVNNTPCFEFGDCIDKGQDDNTFWISQLDAHLRQSTSYLTSALKTVERKIYQPARDDGNLTIFDGTPQPMCMPSQELSQNDAFLRKMHSAYRLAELARKCKIMAMDIVAQVLARLQTISDVLDARKVSDRDALDAVCDQRIDQDRRNRRCQRINDRAPSDHVSTSTIPNSTNQ